MAGAKLCPDLVGLGVVKAQDDVVGLATGVRHQQAVNGTPNGQDVCLNAIRVAQHNCSVGVCVCLQKHQLDVSVRIVGHSLTQVMIQSFSIVLASSRAAVCSNAPGSPHLRIGRPQKADCRDGEEQGRSELT